MSEKPKVKLARIAVPAVCLLWIALQPPRPERRLLMLYVAVCLVRTAYPVLEGPRLCYKHSTLKPHITRFLACIAELALVVVISLHCTGGANSVAWLVICLCVIAECFCYIGVVKNDTRWNAAEISLWVAGALVLAVVCGVSYRFKWCCGFLVFVVYCTVWDIPMYLNRAGEAPAEIGFAECRYTETLPRDDWRWMLLYFTLGPIICVIISNSLRRGSAA